MKYYVCLGDRTTGGGVVVEGNVRTIILGRPVASVGMKAICCNRPQTILQGWVGISIMANKLPMMGAY
jgi:uncharacterized Zn-binding protein involved in type VI secretion